MKSNEFEIDTKYIVVLGNLPAFRKFLTNYRNNQYNYHHFNHKQIGNSKLLLDEENSLQKHLEKAPHATKTNWFKFNPFQGFKNLFKKPQTQKAEKTVSPLKKHRELISELYQIGPDSCFHEEQHKSGEPISGLIIEGDLNQSIKDEQIYWMDRSEKPKLVKLKFKMYGSLMLDPNLSPFLMDQIETLIFVLPECRRAANQITDSDRDAGGDFLDFGMEPDPEVLCEGKGSISPETNSRN